MSFKTKAKLCFAALGMLVFSLLGAGLGFIGLYGMVQMGGGMEFLAGILVLCLAGMSFAFVGGCYDGFKNSWPRKAQAEWWK